MVAPHWYRSALQIPSETGSADVDGVNINYRVWGERGLPGIVLIHGSNAHLEWWRFVAPFLADQFRVVALDSSGNGDSGWRERYSGEIFAREVWAVCQAADLGPMPLVVGHSFGGYVALETGHHFAAALRGVIFMDFTVAPPSKYLEWGMRAKREGVQPARKLRVYEDQEAILARFRLLPEQPGVHPAILNHMAQNAIKQVEGGWTWKFDPALFDHLEMGIGQRDKFAGMACRSAVILGEQSDDEGAYYADHMAEITDGLLPIFKIPGTHHHLMFDEPLVVAMALKAIALDWIREDGSDQISRRLKETLQASDASC